MYSCPPTENKDSTAVFISKPFRKLLCEEQEKGKVNKKDETKVKNKKLFPRNAEKCN
jgi:hypothetical protein